MKITPLITEKSLAEAKRGSYTFYIDPGLSKPEIRQYLGEIFDVHVTSLKTSNLKGRTKRNYKGRQVTIAARKKVMIRLKDGEKLDLFETKEAKKKK